VLEYKTLLVDADPQANSTSGVGFDTRNIKTSIYECIINDENPKNIILSTQTPHLHLLPASCHFPVTSLSLASAFPSQFDNQIAPGKKLTAAPPVWSAHQ